MKKLLVLFVVSLFVFLSTGVVLAKTNNQYVTLGEKEVINHDYFAAGNTVDVLGKVNGDAYIAGGTITINGTITGDLLVAGGNVIINGTVGQDVRVAGGDIEIRGTIGKNITAAGGTIAIDQDAKVAGNVVAGGGNIRVNAKVHDLRVSGGNVRVASAVTGTMTAAAGDLVLAPTASLSGRLEYWGQNKAQIASGASISGPVVYHQSEQNSTDNQKFARFFAGLWLGLKISSFIVSLIIGILMILFAPIFMQKTADVIANSFWKNLLIGLIAVIVIPVVLFLLFVTIIGIPFSLFFFILYFALLYFVKIFVALAIGEKVLGLAKAKTGMIAAYVIGLIIYYLLGFLPIIGGIAGVLVTLVGLGAILTQKRKYYLLLRDKKII